MRQDEQPDVSVVIPVKNEAAGLAACLQGILSQTVQVREIIVIDSGSTDGTQDIARSFDKMRLIEIEPGEFNHGDTRNLGVREASGEFVVFTVGDAQPVDENWLSYLLSGFVADDVVAVAGSQVVPDSKDTNPLEWFRPVSQPEITVYRFPDSHAFEASDPGDKKKATSLDNVTTAYRRAFLLRHPFRKVVYGEDILCALDALKSGNAIAFNPVARVYHFHMENYETVLKRTVAVSSLRYLLTGYSTPPPAFVSTYIKIIFRLIRNPTLNWKERLHWTRYNWNINRAIADGIKMVECARVKGGDALQVLHEQYCDTPPLPLKLPSAGEQ